MVTKSVSEAVASGRALPWMRRGLLGVCFALVTAIFGFIAIKGEQNRKTLEADNARAVAEDDRAFCTMFGIGPGTARYTECVAALSDIRSRHDQRKPDLFL
jgi:hypothetical protein